MGSDSQLTTVRSDGGRATAPREGAAPMVGQTIGRYVVLAAVGRGATGNVLRAYDPKLDRQVALKLLHEGDGQGATQRAEVLAEARALARLRHRHVVTVFDVGEHEGHVWVAMELATGIELGQWAADTRHGTRARLDVLRQAGEGLAAAHAAGIVHRDFKPANVMVGDEVFVVDFGLARGMEPDPRPASVGEEEEELRPPGTPAYLAPELYEGADASPRSDLFSFCVSAWEVLFGRRPFEGDNELALLHAKRRVPELPATPRLPRAFAAALRAGLSADPDARPPDMDALLVTLRRASRRSWGWAAVAVIGVGAAGLGWAALRPPPCRLPEAAAVWEDHDAARAGIEAHAGPHADEVWVKTAENLDAWGARYRAAYREACEATHVRRAQSAALLDRRMACLDRRRAQLAQILEALAEPSPELAADAPRAIAKLAIGCSRSEVEAEGAPTRGPTADALRARLDRVEVLELLTRFDDATTEAEAILADAEALDAADLRLAARYRLGRLREMNGDPKAALDELSGVHFAAEEAGLPVIAARAGVYVVYLQAAVFNDAAAALAWAPHVRSAVVRAGRDPGLEAALIENIGVAKLYAHQVPEALGDFERSLALRESIDGDAEISIVSSLGNLGIAFEELRRYDDAVEHQRRALEILQRRLGEHHPHTARVLDNLGTARLRQGKVDEAVELFQRALRTRRDVYGDAHRSVAISEVHLGLAALEHDAPAEALEHYQAALTIYERLGTAGSSGAVVHEGLAHAHAALQHWPSARRHAEAALAQLPDALPDDHPERRALREILARADEYTGDDGTG